MHSVSDAKTYLYFAAVSAAHKIVAVIRYIQAVNTAVSTAFHFSDLTSVQRFPIRDLKF